jgi:hypothetical protein
MKAEYKLQDMPFSEIKNGRCFLYEETLYLKWDLSVFEVYRSDIPFNASNMDNGMPVVFQDEEKVVPIRIEQKYAKT